ncbi:hydantoinase/oxoprolinase N-terminal domain-containing protein [Geomicrobium sp. JCM 19055]|uniref:hydantoinase/oxoprolinase N-terminal domain-containing protein n=1 Tax=Geomicrobium sp. JCM 19055 TaxID=1460649 RepID=UPI00045EDA9C|nr:hydantoinase/oxoprolinase N-terminal domain-containing protein [Geomicrobium sp. JCM 19055]GAK00629.1 N-methylhydantoinase [Geomicrobium sp. JCM 19055]
MRLGIDVGRSYTDAVLTSENGRIFARTKSTRGEDSVENTRLALATIFGQIKGNEASIKGIFVCSSHIEQALNEVERLAKTYLVRISPMPSILQPAVDWPEDLQDHIVGTTHLSSTEDDQEWEELIVKINESGAQSIAVVGVNAPMDAESERRLGAKITVRLPELAVSLSHQFGSIGFIERENTTLLNAMLRPATVLSKKLVA